MAKRSISRTAAPLLILLGFLLAVTAIPNISRAEQPLIVGVWERTNIHHDFITFFANGTSQVEVEEWGGTYDGRWYQIDVYNYFVQWTHTPYNTPNITPYSDNITVSKDGMSFSGHNNYNDYFDFRKINSIAPTATQTASISSAPQVTIDPTMTPTSTLPSSSPAAIISMLGGMLIFGVVIVLLGMAVIFGIIFFIVRKPAKVEKNPVPLSTEKPQDTVIAPDAGALPGERADNRAFIDVFISYSAKDKNAADAICHGLEAEKIRCWIAPRDTIAGIPFEESIMNAIHRARIFVLVFSSHSNTSHHIENEVRTAWKRGIPIIPFRLEDVPFNNVFDYYISSRHWLDGMTPPLEKRIEELADTIKTLLKEK